MAQEAEKCSSRGPFPEIGEIIVTISQQFEFSVDEKIHSIKSVIPRGFEEGSP